MNWEKLDWPTLDRLRNHFLSGSAASGPYWTSTADLEAYDETFGERIGWKWDTVLAELRLRKWRPASTAVIDIGCGSGIASRRVIRFFTEGNFDRLYLHDHSHFATDYARQRAQASFPKVNTSVLTSLDDEIPERFVLVISHLLNELTSTGKRQLETLMEKATDIIWVEPGTSVVANELVQFRERLRGSFNIVAPCTHQARCGLLDPKNQGHWCHHFGVSAPNVYADSDWVKFAQRAGFDLRSLPYSFLVLTRQPLSNWNGDHAGEPVRIIGDPRLHKGYAKLLTSSASGVDDLTLQKRDAPEVFKSLKKAQPPLLYTIVRNGEKISGITRTHD